jgi:hypothetical protein
LICVFLHWKHFAWLSLSHSRSFVLLAWSNSRVWIQGNAKAMFLRVNNNQEWTEI